MPLASTVHLDNRPQLAAVRQTRVALSKRCVKARSWCATLLIKQRTDKSACSGKLITRRDAAGQGQKSDDGRAGVYENVYRSGLFPAVAPSINPDQQGSDEQRKRARTRTINKNVLSREPCGRDRYGNYRWRSASEMHL